MTRQALLAAAAAFTMIATPALAERGHSSEAATTEAATAPTQAAPDAGTKAEKKTCRTFQNTVSRMKSERVCLTREGWRKFEEQQ
jgi:hypothetical protein